MSVEEAHYTLNGIHLSFQKGDGDAGAVHADTHRLAHSQISVPLSLEATGIILSRKTVTELQSS